MFEFLKGINTTFTIIKIITLIFCLPWPVTILPTVMSLAGHYPQMSIYKKYLIKAGWILLLIYPFIFFKIIKLSENYLYGVNIYLAYTIAVIPIILSLITIYWFITSVK